VQRGVRRWIGGTFRFSEAFFHTVFNRTVENFYEAFTFVVHSAGSLALKLLSAKRLDLFLRESFCNYPIYFYFICGGALLSKWMTKPSPGGRVLLFPSSEELPIGNETTYPQRG
jgi:hypothetical protein